MNISAFPAWLEEERGADGYRTYDGFRRSSWAYCFAHFTQPYRLPGVHVRADVDVFDHFFRDAYAQFRSNKGAPGVDGQEFADNNPARYRLP